MNYSEACAYLDNLKMFRIKLGLETMRELLARLGHPEAALPCIHIAGTNGKGSVGSTLRALLTAGGFRVGFYSSPHLVSVRERFSLGADLISEAAFAAQMSGLLRDMAGGPEPTWFECATLLAFRWFAEQKVDAAIMETGLGGRLDATNVMNPLVSVITDISRDHEAYLGTGLRDIAAEKAGIIKPGVPVLSSNQHGESAAVIAAKCAELGSPLFCHGRDFAAEMEPDGLHYQGIRWDLHNLPLVLSGPHQVVNAALALATMEMLAERFPLSEARLREGMATVRWPGRMEYLHLRNRDIVLDGAHNEAGVRAFVATLKNREPGRRLVLLWANMADKNMDAARTELFDLVDALILTRIDSERSATADDLLKHLPPDERVKARSIEPLNAALDAALASTGPKDLLCVAGSLYMVGEVRGLLLPGAAQ